MLDFMKLAEEEELLPTTATSHYPHHGCAERAGAVSGLRHATIGSVVDVSDASGQSLSQGLVLFMEKKVVHVALLNVSNASPVRKGMDVTLQREQLEIPGSVAAFAGALGEQEEQEEKAANDRVKVTWGAQSVPGLMTRAPLRSPFETGLLAVDCLHPMAHGHRFGVLGPRNSGKTRFIYVCVGKSASRIHQIRDALRITGALEHTTIIASSDRDSLVLQYLAPFTGCAIPRSVVVYDDLATHTTVVEGLVQALCLPRAAQISLSAHAVLMERSAQFRGATRKETGPSLTSFPGIPSEFQERVASLVDDYVGLESTLARSRVFPPVDVLGRVRPCAALVPIGHALDVKQNVEVARKLGFETEPEDAETLEFLELDLNRRRPRAGDGAGAFFLTIEYKEEQAKRKQYLRKLQERKAGNTKA
ncbi:P-loop containing nucleoside triphosphate hydrolase [Phytophthora cactorum]|nr:P-loop containing nucleoside triphosphate hydrolase [Phytophthora cactorum]